MKTIVGYRIAVSWRNGVRKAPRRDSEDWFRVSLSRRIGYGSAYGQCGGIVHPTRKAALEEARLWRPTWFVRLVRVVRKEAGCSS